MKKTCLLILSLLLFSGLFSCGRDTIPASREDKLSVVVTIFPEYDWVRNILGEDPENIELTLLMKNGTDMHSFQPSVNDILTISSCDLFVYVGGESDAWAADVLREAVNPDMTVISLMDVLGSDVLEETLPGVTPDPTEETEYDEHVWLSLKNAVRFMEAISSALEKKDPENASLYRKNTQTYTEKLRGLDASCEACVLACENRTLLFGDRFPFLYFARDYGLICYAAFRGCSSETEASFETILFLSGKIDELSLPAVLVIDGSDRRIAGTIVNNTRTGDQKILEMNSLQSVTDLEIRGGLTYLSVMAENLRVLQEALQ